jgi:flagellar hook-associated protein 1 FlgK
MGNLFTSLITSANGLRAYEQALAVTQNNVTNASTPGYVKQTQSFEALPFDVTVGLPGGVRAGPVVTSRDGYAERAVRDQQTEFGYSDQKTTNLTPLEGSFNLSGTSGIAPAVSNLFQSFSRLSVNPNDTASRQAVIQQAGIVAESFQSTASGLLSQQSSLDRESRGAIDKINQLATTIAQINAHNQGRKPGSTDAGVDAQLNSSLEELSQLVNFTSLQQPDGSVSVYIGGQTALVANDQAYAIQGDFSTSQAKILSSTGSDISGQLTGGKLGALLVDENAVIPSYLNDLNTLAQGLADQVNTTLAQGIDQNGAAPTANLFTYDPAAGAAASLAVNPLTPDQIAAASPGATGGNGNALNLAALADAKTLSGYTFAQFYGNLGGRVGSDLSQAKSDQATAQLVLSQAQDLRTQVSGVSLNEEAEHLVAFQRAYEATSKMIGVLDSLTETLINIIK